MLTVPEVTYTFSIVQGVLDLVKSYCNNSIEFAFKIAEQKEGLKVILKP